MMLDKEKFNWYGMNHDKVRKQYGDLDGNLEYIGTFCVSDRYHPYAVYASPNPDRSKGHKPFVLFHKDPVLLTMFVSGMEAEDMTPFLTQDGVYCPQCDEVLYSVMRHDCRKCSCTATFVDGGRDYLRSNAEAVRVTIGLVTGVAVPA